jgi:eukaryotic-like serine/threonine-protein kinase
MSPRRFALAKDLFLATVDLTPEERRAALSRRCGDDPELRRDVESLFAASSGGDYLELGPCAGLVGDAEHGLPGAERSWEGQRIGPYRVVRLIASGGMGCVFLAERADQAYEGRVALKVVGDGMDRGLILARFRTERQILADLNHPNIARLLDGGTTDEGLPYLVMEYVDGENLLDFADSRRLTIAQRLRLFTTVCSAVQYAHSHLVVHRDLKPGNILVTGDGVPKLLDFGIAKLLQPEPPEAGAAHDHRTAQVFQILTPEYASPEQLRGEPVITASDIYSLGVLLYELLTGHRPYTLATRTPEAALLALASGEPATPSTIVGQSEPVSRPDAGPAATTPHSVSERRRTTPARLRRSLVGDIDTIVLTALHEDPDRRYGSAERLAEDIERHLAGIPVLARRASFAYRAGKFIRRNRLGFTAACLLVVSLASGIAATGWQSRKAMRERARAERRFDDVRQLATSLLFEFHDAVQELPGSTPVRALLVQRAIAYLNGLSREAAGDVALRRELAAAYLKVGDAQGRLNGPNLGDTAGALASYGVAVSICESLVSADPRAVADRTMLATSLLRRGETLSVLGDANAALVEMRRAVSLLEKLAWDNAADAALRRELAEAYSTLGGTTAWAGDFPAALAATRRAGALLEVLAAEDPTDVHLRERLATCDYKTGELLAEVGDRSAALAILHDALSIWNDLCGRNLANAPCRREVAFTLYDIGDNLAALHQRTAALARYREAQAIFEGLLAADPHDADIRLWLAVLCGTLGPVLVDDGEPSLAMESLQRARQTLRDLSLSNPGNTQIAIALAGAYRQSGSAAEPRGPDPGGTQWRAARAWFEKSLRILEDLDRRGMLAGSYRARPGELRARIARCTGAMAAADAAIP